MNYVMPRCHHIIDREMYVARTQASGVTITGLEPGDDPGTCLGITASNLPEGNHTFEFSAHWFIDDCNPPKQEFDTCSGQISFNGVVFVDASGKAEIACQELTGCNSCFREHWGDANISGEFCIDTAKIDGSNAIAGLPKCESSAAIINPIIQHIDEADTITNEKGCPNEPVCNV